MTSSQPAGWTAAELAQAAARGQLDLHYQPLVDLRDHRIAGAEALMRWRHPRLGLLPPGQFLPLAESFGLMPEIGAWVLGEACRQMHKWQGPAWQPFRLAINVSASQVGPTFDDEVKRVLADMALPAELLEIELTESVAFGNPALFASFDALRAIGVRFAADDFGTGYSCLQHLKCCPITTLAKFAQRAKNVKLALNSKITHLNSRSQSALASNILVQHIEQPMHRYLFLRLMD